MSLRFTEFRIDGSSIKELADGSIKVTGQLTHPGIFVYRNSDGTARREYRPADEVFRADSLASFAGVTLTINHPFDRKKGRLVTAENWKTVSIGNAGDDIRQDGENAVGSLYVRDAAAVARVKSGDLRAISCGYEVDFDPTPGSTPGGERYDGVQRNIRGNHIALLPRGVAPRGGNECVLRLDSEGDERFDDEPELKCDVTPEQIAALQSENARLAGENKQLRTDAATGATEVARLTEAVTAATKRATDAEAQLTPARVDALVADRVSTLALAKETGVDPNGKSTLDIKRLIVAKRTPALAGRVDAMDNGGLDNVIAVYGSEPHPSLRDALGPLGGGTKPAGEKPAGGDRADRGEKPLPKAWELRERHAEQSRNAWKGNAS